jgi:hypothetical protein
MFGDCEFLGDLLNSLWLCIQRLLNTKIIAASVSIRFDGNLSLDADSENKATVKMDIRKLSAVLNHTNLVLSSAVFCEYLYPTLWYDTLL